MFRSLRARAREERAKGVERSELSVFCSIKRVDIASTETRVVCVCVWHLLER